MRHSKATTAVGTLRTSAFGMRQAIIVVIAAAAMIWAGAAFAQEAYLSHKLNQQAADLRKQNLQLAVQNQGYKKDVQAIMSGAANEEEARQNGYARPSERLYLVAPPPSPSPSPSPSPRSSPSPVASALASPHSH